GAEGLAYQLERSTEDDTAVVVHLHGSLGMFSAQLGWPPPGDPLLRVGAFMEDTSIEAADVLLAASRSLGELTCERLGIDPGRVPAGARPRDPEPLAPADAPGAASAPRVLFVGNLVANKGFATVLDAFVTLAREHPDVTLTIAGSADEQVAGELAARIASAGLGARVELLGFVEHSRL